VQCAVAAVIVPMGCSPQTPSSCFAGIARACCRGCYEDLKTCRSRISQLENENLELRSQVAKLKDECEALRQQVAENAQTRSEFADLPTQLEEQEEMAEEGDKFEVERRVTYVVAGKTVERFEVAPGAKLRPVRNRQATACHRVDRRTATEPPQRLGGSDSPEQRHTPQQQRQQLGRHSQEDDQDPHKKRSMSLTLPTVEEGTDQIHRVSFSRGGVEVNRHPTDPDADLKPLVLRSKTPRASGASELLSFEPEEPEGEGPPLDVEPGDGAVGPPKQDASGSDKRVAFQRGGLDIDLVSAAPGSKLRSLRSRQVTQFSGAETTSVTSREIGEDAEEARSSPSRKPQLSRVPTPFVHSSDVPAVQEQGVQFNAEASANSSGRRGPMQRQATGFVHTSDVPQDVAVGAEVQSVRFAQGADKARSSPCREPRISRQATGFVHKASTRLDGVGEKTETREEIGEGSAELRFQEPSARELPRIPSTKETRARPRQQMAFAQKAEPQVAAGKSQGDVSVRFVTDAIRAFERKGSDQKQDDERHSVRFLQEAGQEHSAAREARLRQRHVTGFARSF